MRPSFTQDVNAQVAIRKPIATTSGMEACIGDVERASVIRNSPSLRSGFCCVLLNLTNLSDNKIRIRSAISAVWLMRRFGVSVGLEMGGW